MSGSLTPVLVRVVNGQTLRRSILLDKIDRSSGQFETDITYAQQAKQQVYVPYSNPIDPTVAGYVDLYPTDEVLAQMKRPLPGAPVNVAAPPGTIAGLADLSPPVVTFFTHAGALTVTPKVTAAAHVPSGGAGKSGTHGSVATAVAGVAQFTDTTAASFALSDVGKDLTISGSTISANSGTFKIVSFTSTTQVGIANPAATSVGETNNGSLVWTEVTEAQVQITGTTFLSLTPDHTYVTLTNLSGGKQKISDSQIIAAGAPSSISGTSIVIDNALVTIGTPAAGWTATVQANSKVGNTFILT